MPRSFGCSSWSIQLSDIQFEQSINSAFLSPPALTNPVLPMSLKMRQSAFLFWMWTGSILTFVAVLFVF